MRKRRIAQAALLTVFSPTGGNPLTAGVTCPAITPTLGTELLTNPGFEGTYDDEKGAGAGTVNVAPNWDQNAVETDGTDTLDKEITVFHGGSASQKIIVNGGGEGVITATEQITPAGWHQVSFWAYRASGAGSVRAIDQNSTITSLPIGTTGAWVQAIATGRTTANRKLTIVALSNFNGYVDDASAKQITLSSMFSASLGTLPGRDGTYICHPTVAEGTQAGMSIAYLNATNFVIAILYRVGASTTAKLLKFISPTWTEVISGTVTYGAGAELKVVISGTSYSLYYDTAQVGTTQTISDTLGEEVHGFNSYVGNSVGVVSAA